MTFALKSKLRTCLLTGRLECLIIIDNSIVITHASGGHWVGCWSVALWLCVHVCVQYPHCKRKWLELSVSNSFGLLVPIMLCCTTLACIDPKSKGQSHRVM